MWGTARVIVEVSPELILDLGFAALVRRTISEHALAPRCLELALTRRPHEAELRALAAAMRGLREAGVAFALRVDDGCTLRELRRLPLDRLRIEAATLARDGRDLVDGVVALARTLGLQVAVDGIDASFDETSVDELSGAFGTGLPAIAIAAPTATGPIPVIVQTLAM